ncbi:MAG: hypothetical protein KJ709_01775 [Nanoarchaeota archaeon]|nr:hypothetical protein [Nanoarchaeota archaeon]
MEAVIDFGASSIKAVVGKKHLIIDNDISSVRSFVSSLPKGLKLRITGGNTKALKKYLKKARFIDELKAVGYGGIRLAGRKQGTVICVGTGSCIVEARGRHIVHRCGSPLGGGTLEGLARIMGLSLRRLDTLAKAGRAERVNLTVKDITGGPLGKLPGNATASSMYRKGSKADVAAGLFRMVADSVLSIAMYTKARPVIVTGRTTELVSFRKALRSASSSVRLPLMIPKKATYATAYGALRW